MMEDKRMNKIPTQEKFCPFCDGMGVKRFNGEIKKCVACDGTGKLEETEPPYVNRLSEIVGKWPGDESAEEIIEGVKGEPQTNDFLSVLIENYEAAKSDDADEDCFAGTTKKEAVIEIYEDLIEIYKSNYHARK